MIMSQEQNQAITTLKSLYENIIFYGIYVDYTHSLSLLAKILKMDDAAELHYIMMHLSRLSYFKNIKGDYLWGSDRFMELMNCENALELKASKGMGVFSSFTEAEFARMEQSARQSQIISSNLISSDLKGHGYFTCYTKVYPVYHQENHIIGSLTILAQPAHTEQTSTFTFIPEEVSESALLI